MAGTITVSTISDGVNSTSSTNCIKGSAKAWVSFLGSSNTIQASFNVGSITKNGTGDYTINFSTAFADVYYCTAGFGATGNGRFMAYYNGTQNTGNSTSALTTTTCRVGFITTGVNDSDPCNLIFFHA